MISYQVETGDSHPIAFNPTEIILIKDFNIPGYMDADSIRCKFTWTKHLIRIYFIMFFIFICTLCFFISFSDITSQSRRRNIRIQSRVWLVRCFTIWNGELISASSSTRDSVNESLDMWERDVHMEFKDQELMENFLLRNSSYHHVVQTCAERMYLFQWERETIRSSVYEPNIFLPNNSLQLLSIPLKIHSDQVILFRLSCLRVYTHLLTQWCI